jgi:hypothetical protein
MRMESIVIRHNYYLHELFCRACEAIFDNIVKHTQLNIIVNIMIFIISSFNSI